jgi:hypothetical protein
MIPMLRVGFTGSRTGMSEKQKEMFEWLLSTRFQTPEPFEFHNGMCLGADEDSFRIILDKTESSIILHPSNLKDMQFKPPVKERIHVLPEKPPLQRNEDIVVQSDKMIACPKDKEQQRSGTWYTIRFSKKRNRPTYIIYPNGHIIFYDTGKFVYDITPQTKTV